MCPCDWFNKEVNCQQLGKKRFGGTSGDTEVSGKKKGGVISQTHRKQDMQEAPKP